MLSRRASTQRAQGHNVVLFLLFALVLRATIGLQGTLCQRVRCLQPASWPRLMGRAAWAQVAADEAESAMLDDDLTPQKPAKKSKCQPSRVSSVAYERHKRAIHEGDAHSHGNRAANADIWRCSI